MIRKKINTSKISQETSSISKRESEKQHKLKKTLPNVLPREKRRARYQDIKQKMMISTLKMKLSKRRSMNCSKW